MKQGRASPNGSAGQKREPISHAISPGGAAQIGRVVGSITEVIPLYTGRGFQAPAPVGSTTHRSGSQGKHR